jgi:PAS domain S-box-containing protein
MSKNKSVILVVDDKPANVLALENLLMASDRLLLTATTGEKALKLTLNKVIDLIILDVQMPGMDGFEVARILKSNKRTRNIPIIFATAENKERKFMMQGYDEGAIDYLFKPLDPDIVKAKVTVLLQIQLQKKELIEKNFSLQKSELLINNSADIIGIIDQDSYQFEQVNNAIEDILGYSVEEIKVMNLLSLLSDEDRQILKDPADKDKERLSFENRVYCKDGTRKWLQWKVFIKDGKWFVNARDINEIKQLHHDLQININQLELTNLELESFSYSVSHDLRAPLRALSGFSKIMEEQYLSSLDEEASRLLGNIRRNAKKMGVLIDDLLEFSRLGRKEIQKSEIDMTRMVETVLIETARSKASHVSIIVDPLPSADADHGLLHQVWVNLVSNAIKYSAKKDRPEIHIGAEESSGGITYFIRDNGSGFDMTYADKLFGVFQRLHNPNEFEGTGVGLAIVQRIITRHGGTVRAHAKLNEGATFYFTLPKQEKKQYSHEGME